MNAGVCYLNVGNSNGVRLLVSLHSLRKHWHGPVTVVSIGPVSEQLILGLTYAEVVDVAPLAEPGHQAVFLEKALMGYHTPYDLTVFIDSDTLVRGPIDELFDHAAQHGFVATQFATWTTHKRLIRKRLRAWLPHYPNRVAAVEAASPYAATNAGVYAWARGSPFMRDWYKLTLPGRSIHLPEETLCNIFIPEYGIHVADQKYNCSCKYSTPHDPDTRIVHFHGRKHCREGLPFGADLWWREFEETMEEDPCGISRWAAESDRWVAAELERRRHADNEVYEIRARNP